MSIAELDTAFAPLPAATPPQSDDEHAWLRDFRKRHGRDLRVLHVGNIANNAFLNSKFLRRVGVESDVLCYDYYHVMGTPEWEDVDVRRPYGDDYHPQFAAEDLAGYQRPPWFFQAPLPECHRQMRAADAVASGEKSRAPLPPLAGRAVRVGPRDYVYQLLNTIIRSPRFHMVWRGLRLRYVLAPAAVWILSRMAMRESGRYIAEFAKTFPERPDQLRTRDLVPFFAHVSLFREIFDRYDIVQLYSTDPMFGWLAGNRPYVGFEHGTLRDFTLGDNAIHRLTAMGYRKADHVFITNGDCLEYAQKIGVERYSAMLHPVDVEQHRAIAAEPGNDLKAQYGADVLLFCPIRHAWEAKGTDVNIRAFPLIRQRVGGRVKLLLSRWGEDHERSAELVRELGIEDDVVWLTPLARPAMIRHLAAADVVLDQIGVPCFGVTAPQALAIGTPIVSSYKPESTDWIVEEPAPILPAFSAAEVADAVVQALDPAWRRGFNEKARGWVDRQHSPARLVAEHLRVYHKIAVERGLL